MSDKKKVEQVNIWTLIYLEDPNVFCLGINDNIYTFSPAQFSDLGLQGQNMFNNIISKKSFNAINDFLAPRIINKKIKIPQIRPLNDKDKLLAITEVEAMLKNHKEKRSGDSTSKKD